LTCVVIAVLCVPLGTWRSHLSGSVDSGFFATYLVVLRMGCTQRWERNDGLSWFDHVRYARALMFGLVYPDFASVLVVALDVRGGMVLGQRVRCRS
jgi:hypothetical protein